MCFGNTKSVRVSGLKHFFFSCFVYLCDTGQCWSLLHFRDPVWSRLYHHGAGLSDLWPPMCLCGGQENPEDFTEASHCPGPEVVCTVTFTCPWWEFVTWSLLNARRPGHMVSSKGKKKWVRWALGYNCMWWNGCNWIDRLTISFFIFNCIGV